MRTFLFLSITILLCQKANGQLFDSIEDSFRYKPTFFLKFDSRNSFVTNYYAPMGGIKVGLSFNNTSKIGIGYSWMKNYPVSSGSNIHLQFGYLAPFFEYTFYKSNKWTGEIPLQIGYGFIRHRDIINKSTIIKSGIVIYEPAMTFDYRFWNYFSIGAGAGIRFALKMNGTVPEKFASPIYIFRFKISFGDIYKDHLKKEKTS